MSTRLDWSDGPIPCAECGQPMRPAHTQREGRWAGTVLHEARGLCGPCRRRRPGSRETLRAALDWSRGPVPCAVCKQPMRPTSRRASEPGWQGTRAHGARGVCRRCYAESRVEGLRERERAAESVLSAAPPAPPSLRRLAGLDTGGLVASPSLGREVTWPWRMLPGGMSMVQQELECLADLADQLRREGLVAMSRPRRSVRHGTDATILLTLTVRPATPEEARALGHEPRPAQGAEPGEATERAGVAA